MAISTNLLQRLRNSIKESTSTASQAGQVVINPDGSDIGSAPGSSVVDDTASNFTVGTTRVTPIAGYVDDVSPDTVAEGRAGAVRITPDRFLMTSAGTLGAAEDQTNGVDATVNKKLAVSTYVPTSFQNLGANATLNVKASAGNVFSLTCHNENVADRWLLLHNSATTSSGAPLQFFLVPAGEQIIVGEDYFTQSGLHFSTGIAFGFSTTKDTYTAGAAADHSTVINYK